MKFQWGKINKSWWRSGDQELVLVFLISPGCFCKKKEKKKSFPDSMVWFPIWICTSPSSLNQARVVLPPLIKWAMFTGFVLHALQIRLFLTSLRSIWINRLGPKILLIHSTTHKYSSKFYAYFPVSKNMQKMSSHLYFCLSLPLPHKPINFLGRMWLAVP